MIEMKSVSLSYGNQPVLKAQDLSLSKGEHIALMGPSGCGKTSMLRLAAKLTAPTKGSLCIHARRIAFLFQEPRLLPWLTAEENVNAVLSDRPATLPEARKWLEAVGLTDTGTKYPHELSGGMQQRVSLARALAYDGDLLLLDEPLKGLDTGTKTEMLRLIQQHSVGKTLLLATHDREEAAALTQTLYSYQEHRFVRTDSGIPALSP